MLCYCLCVVTRISRQLLCTAQGAALTLTCDRKSIHAKSNDLAFVEIEYRDKNGTLDMSIQRKVSISVEGDIELCGSGSANPKTKESYLDAEHLIFEGRAIAVIRPKNKTGAGKVVVTDNLGACVETSFIVV